MWKPRFSAVVIFSLIGGLFMWAGVSPALAEKRVALVIGNSSYEHVSSLPNPDNDATDLAAKLEKLGFIVRRERNLGRHAMQDVLAEFSDTANGADMAVIYYAGHGIGVDKQNFLIPVDARLSSDRKIKFETVPLDTVLSSLEGVRGVRMILLDACRNNPFAGKMKLTSASRSVSRGLQRVEPSRGTLISFAAKDGTTADDGQGRNSPYTAALLKQLDQPGVELQFMFRKVRDQVLEATGGAQEPFTYGSLPGKQIFLKLPKAKTPATAAPAATPLAIELAYWNAIKDTDEPALVRSYLEKFPDGQFILLAKALLKRLGANAKRGEELVIAAKQPRGSEPNQTSAIAPRELALRIQQNLARLGCSPGQPDGNWGAKSRRALKAFAHQSKQQIEGLEPTVAVLNVLSNWKEQVCARAIYLTQQQIVATHVGKCVSYWGKTRGIQCILANGTTNYNDRKWGKDTGKWWFQGDRFCERWSKDPNATCERIKTVGTDRYTDGSGYTWTVK